MTTKYLYGESCQETSSAIVLKHQAESVSDIPLGGVDFEIT